MKMLLNILLIHLIIYTGAFAQSKSIAVRKAPKSTSYIAPIAQSSNIAPEMQAQACSVFLNVLHKETAKDFFRLYKKRFLFELIGNERFQVISSSGLMFLDQANGMGKQFQSLVNEASKPFMDSMAKDIVKIKYTNPSLLLDGGKNINFAKYALNAFDNGVTKNYLTRVSEYYISEALKQYKMETNLQKYFPMSQNKIMDTSVIPLLANVLVSQYFDRLLAEEQLIRSNPRVLEDNLLKQLFITKK
jgi:hypothetical protein